MPYCSDCGTEVATDDQFCSDCGTELQTDTGTDHQAKVTTEPSGGWWLGVFLPVISVFVPLVLAFLFGFLSGFTGASSPEATYDLLGQLMLWGTGLSVFVAPVAFHFDSRYVRAVSDWTPSKLYYLLFVPVLNLLLALGYLNQRHQVTGVP